MIECDKCHEWYHGECVGITLRQGKQMERQGLEYICEKCRGKLTFKLEHGPFQVLVFSV